VTDALVPISKPLTPLATPSRVDQHPAAVYLARLAPGSRRAMQQALEVVAGALSGGRATVETFRWAELRYQHAQALRSAVAEKYSPASANKILSALRGVTTEAWRLGQLGAEDRERIAGVAGVKGSSPLRGRALKHGEIAALFGSCDREGAAGTRDAAILALLYGAGMRRSEVVGLRLSDYDAETGALTIRHGKGNKTRTAYATNGAKAAIDSWLSFRGPEPGSLLLAIRKDGSIRQRDRLTGQAVYAALERMCVAAKVAPFSPHDFRRTAITHLLGAGVSIATVQKIAGHASINTTARYDRSDEDAKRKAAEMIHIPW
jgi:integrase/recombinase XerD